MGKEKLEKRKYSPAVRAWGAMALLITGYEIICPPGETLSEGVDRFMERGPLAKAAVLSGLAVTACHLGNILPEKIDPFHYALMWKDRPESEIEKNVLNHW